MQKSGKFFLAMVLGLVLVVGAGVAWVATVLATVPDFNQMRSVVVVPIKKADKSEATKPVGPKAPGWVPMNQISNHALMAVIASEDTSFFSHDGVDFHELKLAIKKDFEEKRWARGASTITQQVVKNVYLSQEKTLTRKVREILWAREMDKVLSKSEILCFYMNLVEWGPGIYGIRDASRTYFQRSPSELTPRQAAFLAMMLPSPRRYYSYFANKQLTGFARGRIEQILRVMNRMGFLEDGEYEAARRESLWGEAVEVADTVGDLKEDDLPEDPPVPKGAPVEPPAEAPAPTPAAAQPPAGDEAAPVKEETPQ